MIYTPLTKKAMNIAYQAHNGQLDKSGMPYIFHPFHLAEQMNDEYSTIVALLHDVVEDTHFTLDDIIAEGFPSEVINAIALLTHEKKEPYFDYVKRIKQNSLAAIVKMADLRHNSDLSRLDTIDDKAFLRIEKYQQAIKILSESLVEVVAALIWDKDKFMICQRPSTKSCGMLWEFVGGKVEPGETKEQALVRECQEELAITLTVGSEFMDVVHEYPDITVHLTLFHATIAEGVPQKLEHNDIRWITPAEIPQYKFCPADEVILERLKQL